MSRCEKCDREECPRMKLPAHLSVGEYMDDPEACPGCVADPNGEARNDCDAHAVDWRARCLAAECEADRLRHGQAVEGDFVCPDALRADRAESHLAAERERALSAERERDEARRLAEEAREALELLREAATEAKEWLNDAAQVGSDEWVMFQRLDVALHPESVGGKRLDDVLAALDESRGGRG